MPSPTATGSAARTRWKMPAKAVPRRGVMNGIESRYATHLDMRELGGEIQEWAFESERLLIAEGERRKYYTADFRVVLANGEVEMHEVKGTWKAQGQVAARLRMDVANSLHPYRFVAVTEPRKGEWEYEVLK